MKDKNQTIYVLGETRDILAGMDAISTIQAMVAENVAQLDNKHCETCNCGPSTPKCFDLEKAKAFLNIDVSKIKKVEGGY